MSHAATNWAIQQKGLKPATKIVLWHLADCHNPAHGCFPSQAYLSEACEMSRSTLNVHLNILVERGLIRRDATVDTVSRRQRPTRYFLAFEETEQAKPEPKAVSGNRTRSVSGKRAKPCPDFGESRVRNPDTNPVKEPVTNPRARTRGASPAKAAQGGEVASRDEASKRERIAGWINGGPPICGGWITPERLGAMVEAGLVTAAQADGALRRVGAQPLGDGANAQRGGNADAESPPLDLAQASGRPAAGCERGASRPARAKAAKSVTQRQRGAAANVNPSTIGGSDGGVRRPDAASDGPPP